MRGTLRAFGLVVLLALIGCHHDKYNTNPKFVEEPIQPPDEKRYNEPDKAGYRSLPPKKEDKTGFGKQGGGGPGGPNGI